MAAFQNILLGYQKISQKNSLAHHLQGMIKRYFLSDLKALLQPGQAPVPLVTAVALGTILSFIPAPFVDTLLVGLIFARFRWLNRSALIAARIVWNDLIVVPLYVPGFRFGMRMIEPFVVNDTTYTIKLIAFFLGLVFLTTAATFLSAAIMLALVTGLKMLQNSR